MMTECPRCGFVQPKDQYCANCGLDIDHYSPKPPPLHIKLWKNYAPIISVLLLTITITGTFYYIKNNERLKGLVSKENLDEKYATHKKDQEEPQINSKSLLGQEKNIDPSLLKKTKANTPSKKLIESPKKDATVSTIPTKIHILFTEAVTEWGLDLFSQGEALGNELRISIIKLEGPLLTKINEYESKQQLHKLGSGKNTKLNINTPISFNFTATDPTTKEDLGLFLEASAMSITQKNTLMDLKGFSYIVRADTGDHFQINIQEQFEIPHGKTALITGVLPHFSLKSELQDNLSLTPLKILDSPDYKAQSTEFYIFLQPQP